MFIMFTYMCQINSIFIQCQVKPMPTSQSILHVRICFHIFNVKQNLFFKKATADLIALDMVHFRSESSSPIYIGNLCSHNLPPQAKYLCHLVDNITRLSEIYKRGILKFCSVFQKQFYQKQSTNWYVCYSQVRYAHGIGELTSKQ